MPVVVKHRRTRDIDEIMTEFSQQLEQYCREASCCLEPETGDKLGQFYATLNQWRKKTNLVGKLDEGAILRSLFADSLTGLSVLDVKPGRKLLDVGTGAGFPGMVIAIVRRDLSVTLMDSSRKKMDFLSSACRLLGLTGVELIQMRAEDAGRSERLRESFDVVVSKGLAPLNVLIELCAPLVEVGGKFAAWKGINYHKEIDTTGASYPLLGLEKPQIHPVNPPVTSNSTFILEFDKTAGTSDRYPRNYRAITRKPIFTPDVPTDASQPG